MSEWARVIWPWNCWNYCCDNKNPRVLNGAGSLYGWPRPMLRTSGRVCKLRQNVWAGWTGGLGETAWVFEQVSLPPSALLVRYCYRNLWPPGDGLRRHVIEEVSTGIENITLTREEDSHKCLDERQILSKSNSEKRWDTYIRAWDCSLHHPATPRPLRL